MAIQKYNDHNSSLKQKFDHYEVDLPADDWTVFSRKLAEAQSKHRRFAWYYIPAAASVIGLLFLGVSYFVTNTEPDTRLLHIAGVTPTISHTRTIAAHRASTSTTTNGIVAQNNGQLSPQSNPGSSIPAKTIIIPATEIFPNNRNDNEAIPQNTPATCEPANNAQAKSVAVNNSTVNDFDTTGYITHPVKQYAALPDLPVDKKENNPSDKRKATGAHNLINWMAGTVQGNLGLSSGSDGNVLSDGSIGTHLLTRVTKAEALQSSSEPTTMSFSGNKTYYLPLTFGLTAGLPLNGRWELQSGFVYTLLTTTGTVSSSSSARATGRIEQHYLGIPVSLAYAFIKKSAYSVYVNGGGRVEKGISRVEKTYTYDSQDKLTGQTSYHYSIDGLQFSLDAGVGATYRLYRFINWYLEVGGAWYIPSDQPESSRTEHPVNVSIKTGVRFSFSK
jgi:hypothetical protein